MALKDIVKGICNVTRCKYDVYTKERTDELLTTAKTEVDNKIKGIKLTYGLISNLDLGPGSSYQIELPANAIWVEPLIWANAVSDDGGGGVLVPIGGGFVYVTGSDHIDSENQHRGVWCQCNREGLFSVSDYRHCGRNIVGLRVWFLDLE